jgi:hypothetical protein
MLDLLKKHSDLIFESSRKLEKLKDELHPIGKLVHRTKDDKIYDDIREARDEIANNFFVACDEIVAEACKSFVNEPFSYFNAYKMAFSISHALQPFVKSCRPLVNPFDLVSYIKRHFDEGIKNDIANGSDYCKSDETSGLLTINKGPLYGFILDLFSPEMRKNVLL